jgi:tRNA(Arg) A34 adenosine deaminase TadA
VNPATASCATACFGAARDPARRRARGALVVRRRRTPRTEPSRETPIRGPCRAARFAACCAAGPWRLDGCTLYVTLEPCAMCASHRPGAGTRLVIGRD